MPVNGGRVDHWANLRDRSVGPVHNQSLKHEIARLREKVAKQQAKIAKLCTALEAAGVVADPQTGRKLAESIAIKHGISFSEMISSRRAPHLVRARQEAMWHLREHTKLSYPQIAYILGKRDHTTIIHGIKRHAERMARGEL